MKLARQLSVAVVVALTAWLSSGSLLAQVMPGMMPVPQHPQLVPSQMQRFNGEGSGTLQALSPDGKSLVCPLKHTDVHATISGYVARVTVKQIFDNPFKDKIEAVYTFPLSDSGAVDDMLMQVGKRTIHGAIKKREEAQQIYNDAKRQGHVAALLNQERPNIFTQSVANIEPGKEITVTLSYVDLLPYEAGNYKFAFPTVVGPRFNPGTPVGNNGTGFSPDTTEVPDASKITPHIAPEGVRAGHDISIDVTIDGGVPIGNINSQLHEIKTERLGATRAHVSLVNKSAIPNKDFVLSWAVSSDNLKSGYLANGSNGNGYFTLMILPPKTATKKTIQPKEMIFLIDCSGSQRGWPLEKAKEAMLYSLDQMNDNDTFQVIAFNNVVTRLFERPRIASTEMRATAKEFVKSLDAHGGTWMEPAVEAACKEPADEHRLRIVSFMTDGFVGNDFEIVGLIRKLRDTSRWFPFGTGNSVNRFLIDNIARVGGGEPDYVYLNSDVTDIGKRFYDKIASPVLTDVKVDFGSLPVKEVFPHEVSDVWEQHPLYITGRYTHAGAGTVTITGFSGGKPYRQTLNVAFPENDPANAVLGSIWARAKVDRLMDEDLPGAQSGSVNAELKDEIVKVALDHHIMTQYTSFVAVEQQTVTKGGQSQTVEVPVELPDGVSREGITGEPQRGRGNMLMSQRHSRAMSPGAGLGQPMASSVPQGSVMSFAGTAAAGGSGVPNSLGPALSGAVTGTIGPAAPLPPSTPVTLHSAEKQIQIGDSSRVSIDYRSARKVSDHVSTQERSYAPNASPQIAAQIQAPAPPTAVLGASSMKSQYKAGRASFGRDKFGPVGEDAAADETEAPIDRAAATAKLSPQLQKLMAITDHPEPRNWVGIPFMNGAVQVKIKLKDSSADSIEKVHHLARLMVEIIPGDRIVTAWISADKLLRLANYAEVAHIELVSP